MTTFTMRHIKGHFVVTGPDVPPTQFKSRAEARDWCKAHYPGSPITEVGRADHGGRKRRDASRRMVPKAKGRPNEPKGSAGVVAAAPLRWSL